jgi:hypothetical protein
MRTFNLHELRTGMRSWKFVGGTLRGQTFFLPYTKIPSTDCRSLRLWSKGSLC